MNLNVIGFGACMIAGYPFAADQGFLHRSIQELHRSGKFKPSFEIIAMGGFPAHRAGKHFAKRVLAHKPDVVVLQFGSTDASAPLRNAKLLRREPSHGPHVREKVSEQLPTTKDRLKWRLRSLASEILRVPPISSLEDYLAAVTKMTEEARAAGSVVVVISPFIMGSGHSDRLARRYARALAAKIQNISGAIFLDAHALLSREPRKKMLLRDGFHLSPEAHGILAMALAEAIRQAAEKR